MAHAGVRHRQKRTISPSAVAPGRELRGRDIVHLVREAGYPRFSAAAGFCKDCKRASASTLDHAQGEMHLVNPPAHRYLRGRAERSANDMIQPLIKVLPGPSDIA